MGDAQGLMAAGVVRPEMVRRSSASKTVRGRSDDKARMNAMPARDNGFSRLSDERRMKER